MQEREKRTCPVRAVGCEEYVVVDKDHQTGRAGDEADNFISN